MNIQKGKIDRFVGSHYSGLGHLVIDGIPIPCDNAPTVRALEACFGNVISEGHTVDNNAIRGKEVFFSTDFVGILEGFTPCDEAPEALVQAYEAQYDTKKPRSKKRRVEVTQ